MCDEAEHADGSPKATEPPASAAPGGRRLLIGLCISALTWSVLMATTERRPSVGLGGWCSDHYSHIYATVLFLHEGYSIYTTPVRDLCIQPPAGTPAARDAARRFGIEQYGICWLPRPKSREPDLSRRPLVINWPAHPRPYPPGQLVYFMPEALLFMYAGLGFEALNTIAIVKFTLVAHLCIWLVALIVGASRSRPLSWLIIALTYLLLMPWSLAGIYDGIALLPLLGMIYLLQTRRPLLAASCGGLALFLHFRSLWYLPLMIHAGRLGLASGLLGRSPSGDSSSASDGAIPLRTQKVLLGASGLLAALSLVIFVVLLPSLRQYPVTNKLYHAQLGVASAPAWGLALVTLVGAGLLALGRRWLLLATILWTTLFLVQAPQAMPWHAMFLLPALLLPLVEPRDSDRDAPLHGTEVLEQLTIVLVWFFLVSQLAFGNPFDGGWLSTMATRLLAGQ